MGDGSIKRDRSGKWLKGTAAPNPGGRPKANEELVALIGQDGVKVWAALWSLHGRALESGELGVALNCLRLLAEKSIPNVEHSAPSGVTVEVISPEQAAVNRERLARLLAVKIEERAEALTRSAALPSGPDTAPVN